MYNSQFCEENNKPETQVWYKTCTYVWPAVQTAMIHDLRNEIDQIYEEEFPAIIPNYKVGPIQEPYQLNKSPTVSRKKRFIIDIIGLGIQAFSAISQHRKQSELQKSMKHLKHRQDVLDYKIEALEDDIISITKKTFEELDYLKRELELTGYNIKVLSKLRMYNISCLDIWKELWIVLILFCSLVVLFLYYYLKWKDIWHYMKEQNLN